MKTCRLRLHRTSVFQQRNLRVSRQILQKAAKKKNSTCKPGTSRYTTIFKIGELINQTTKEFDSGASKKSAVHDQTAGIQQISIGFLRFLICNVMQDRTDAEWLYACYIFMNE